MRLCMSHTQVPDEPFIPPEILSIFDGDEKDDLYAGVDKAATPAERPATAEDMHRDFDRARPLQLYPQRDSDANKNIMTSREEA